VRVITAAGGLEAIQLARTHRPEVVFMDLKMSDLDGLEATRRLRADPATTGIPVIAVTASAFDEVRETARAAGCTDYLSKPVLAASLFAMLQRHLGVRFESGAADAVPPETDFADRARRAGIADRLRDALALGDINDIQRLAHELMDGSNPEAAFGQRINKLVTSFDFDGLGELAAWLAIDGGDGRAGS
jgi:CheY-like chemotaxis protein